VLAEGERWSVSGLCGRLWTLRRDYPQLHGADEFRAWEEPGTARVLIAHWIEPAGDAGAALVSESRVEPTDRGAAFRLRALWAVGPGGPAPPGRRRECRTATSAPGSPLALRPGPFRRGGAGAGRKTTGRRRA